MEIPKFNLVEHYRNLSNFLMAQYHLSTTFNHRGSKGLIREKILVDTLQSISNDYVLLTKGEVCDSTGRRSPEFDVIVSHRSSALRLFSSASHTVVPIEAVLGVIEVKTKLSEVAVKTFNKSIATVNSFERFFKPTAMYQQLGAITGNKEFQSFVGKPLKPTDSLLGLERIVGGIFAFELDSIDAVKGFLDRFQPEVNFGFVCVLNQFIALPNGQKMAGSILFLVPTHSQVLPPSLTNWSAVLASANNTWCPIRLGTFNLLPRQFHSSSQANNSLQRVGNPLARVPCGDLSSLCRNGITYA